MVVWISLAILAIYLLLAHFFPAEHNSCDCDHPDWDFCHRKTDHEDNERWWRT